MANKYGFSRPTFYFYSEGRQNLEKTVELVYKRVSVLKRIKKILVFTANGEGAFMIKDLVSDTDIQVISATFPYKQSFYFPDGAGNKKEVFADTSDKEICAKIKQYGITLIQGVMPLQDIPVPGTLTSDTKIKTIVSTLSLFSGGLKLCIDGIIMASDAGYVEQGEEIISFSADTAIVATGCRKDRLFHPEEGLEIREFICKPRDFSLTHTKK